MASRNLNTSRHKVAYTGLRRLDQLRGHDCCPLVVQNFQSRGARQRSWHALCPLGWSFPVTAYMLAAAPCTRLAGLISPHAESVLRKYLPYPEHEASTACRGRQHCLSGKV
jgi:hypothetical protein